MHRRQRERPPGAVAGVDRKAQVRAREPQIAAHVAAVGRLRVVALDPTAAREVEILARDHLAQRADLVARQCLLAAHQLEAVFVRRIVAAGDLHAALEVAVKHPEVEQRRGTDALVDHVHPRLQQALEQRRVQPVRAQPAVAPERHRALALSREEAAEGASEVPRQLVVEIALGLAADVVLSKDKRIHVGSIGGGRSGPR